MSKSTAWDLSTLIMMPDRAGEPRVGRSLLRGRESGQRQYPLASLADQVSRVDGQVAEAVHPAGGPADLDRFDRPRRSEAEMEPRVAGRGVAAAPEPPGGLPPPGADDRHTRPDRIAVRCRPLEAQRYEMAGALGPVVEVRQRRVLRDQQEVGAPVVVEVG